MRMNKFVFIGLVLVVLSGCASVPRESAQLSSEMSTMVRNARESHFALIDEYMRQRQERVDEFMEHKWIPTYMRNFMQNSKFAELYDAEKDATEREKMSAEFQEQASIDISAQRATMMRALSQVESTIRQRVAEHYDQILMINDVLTAHLLSASKVSAAREDVMKRLNVPVQQLVPFEKLDVALGKIERFEGKADALSQLVNEAKGIITQEETNK